MKKLLVVLAGMIATAPALAKKQEAPVDPGPPPASLEEFKRLGQQALLDGFFDPGSAEFKWDLGIRAGYWKPILQPKVAGWVTCGLVNAKNRMGGYVGFRRFVLVERDGRVVFSAISDGDQYDLVDLGCRKSVSSGFLTPAAQSPASESPFNPALPHLGLGFEMSPQGMLLTWIEPGSAAERAGLKPSMIISHVNGIPLAGFDSTTVTKMLHVATGEITFTLMGKGDVKVTKPQPHSQLGSPAG